MKFTTIYKNGKPDYFFIKIDSPNEFNFIQPYFIITSADRQRHGRIKEMQVLFSGEVFSGKQTHGYGYSCSADVYGELITIINKLHSKKLSDRAKKELSEINTHDEALKISEATLEELRELNTAAIEAKFAWD